VIWRARLIRWLRHGLPPVMLGGITLFAFAPFSFWPLAILSLALAFGMIDVAPSARRAAWLGWAYGLGYFLAATHWIYISLHDYGGLPAIPAMLAVLLLAAFLALYPALAAWVARRVTGEHRAALLLAALPAMWLLTEWLRGWVFTGFPWSAIGYTQVPAGPLAGYLPVVGIYGVGGMLAWLAGAAAWLLGRRPDRHDALVVLAAVGLCAGGIGLSRVSWTEPVGKPLQVALLQGAIPQNQKWGLDDLLFNLRTYYRLMDAAQGELIVLPETAFPVFLHESPSYYLKPEAGRAAERRFPLLPDDYLAMMLDKAHSKQAALIAGVPRFGRDGAHYYNGAVLLSDPTRPGNYKSHLVPFGEYVPMRWLIGWIYRILQMPLDDFAPGPSEQAPLQIGDQRIAANICYEDIFGEELLGSVRNATILLNLSNLAWFDGSVALAQHGQIAQARSIETGRPSLLATNSGTTAVVRADGQYQATLPERKPMILQATVQGRTGRTPYMRWGNVAALALAVAGLLIARRLKVR
jgi:apolipoprotein N-acyltransferase